MLTKNNMENVVLKKITKYTTDKEGKPLVSAKTNKSYTRLVIETEEHDKPLSGFENQETSKWKVGDSVEIEVKENGQYLNFSVPKKEDKIDEKLEMILNRLVGLKLTVDIIHAHIMPPKKATVSDYPEEDYPTDE